MERAPRAVDIPRLVLVEAGPDFLKLGCDCSKGTYIRVLGEDIARALGTVGHLSALRRTWVAPFRDMPMVSLESVLAGAREGQGLLPPDTALAGLAQSHLTEEQCRTLRHGQAVRSAITPAVEPGRRVRLYGPGGEFLGLGEARPEGWLQPRRLLLATA